MSALMTFCGEISGQGKSTCRVNDKLRHMCYKYSETGLEFEQFYNSWYTIPFICWVLQQKQLDVHVYGKSPCGVNDKFWHMCCKYSYIGQEFEQFYNSWYTIPFICWVLQQKELDVYVDGKSPCRVNDKFRHMCYKYSDIGLEFEQFYNTWYISPFICWVLQQKELDVHFIMLTNNSNVTREVIKTWGSKNQKEYLFLLISLLLWDKSGKACDKATFKIFSDIVNKRINIRVYLLAKKDSNYWTTCHKTMKTPCSNLILWFEILVVLQL